MEGWSLRKIMNILGHASEKQMEEYIDISDWEWLQYNGFSWDGLNRLYNPFFFLKFLADKEFGNYWFASGTPSFLIQLIKEQKHLPERFEQTKTNDLEGGSVNIKNLPLLPLLFQTGYLTISKIDYDGFQQRFYLDYPNEEYVKERDKNKF